MAVNRSTKSSSDLREGDHLTDDFWGIFESSLESIQPKLIKKFTPKFSVLSLSLPDEKFVMLFEMVWILKLVFRLVKMYVYSITSPHPLKVDLESTENVEWILRRTNPWHAEPYWILYDLNRKDRLHMRTVEGIRISSSSIFSHLMINGKHVLY